MFSAALIFYMLFLAAYAVFLWVIAYHIRKYSMPGEKRVKSIEVFFIITALLIILSFIAFIHVPWNELRITHNTTQQL